MSLLRKILIRVILLLLLASIIIGGISYVIASNNTNELTMNMVEHQLLSSYELIEEKLDSTKRMMNIIASGDSVLKDLESGKTSTETSSVFTKVLNENSDLISLISIVDRDGIVLNTDSSNTNVIGADLSTRGYMVELSKTGKTVISDVIISKATGAHVIAIATPVFYNGVYMGAIVSTIDFKLVTDVFSDTVIGKEGYAYMFDGTGDNYGLVVAHKDPAMTEEEKNVYDFNIPGLSALADKARTEDMGSSYYEYKGSKFAEYKRVGNWILVITAAEKDLKSTSISIRNTSIVVILLSVLLASILIYITVNGLIIKPLHKLENAMMLAGEGDLTKLVEINTRDEIQRLGDSFNTMISNQRNILTNINKISGDLTASSEELTASASDVNFSAEEISKNVEEMMSNTHMQTSQLDEVIEEVAILNTSIDNSHALSKKSHESCIVASKSADKGRISLVESINSIENISESTDQIIDNFIDLNEHAKEVTGISETIKGIASQINLLALNASIEAARAGEAGKGFTVVAEEVRKLAEQTTTESESISGVLSTITNLINDADKCVSITKKQVDLGESSIKSLDGKLIEIVNTFKALDVDIVSLEEISSDQVEISDKIVDYVKGVSRNAEANSEMAAGISASTEEQTAVTESLSGASEETSNMASELNKMIDQFKI